MKLIKISSKKYRFKKRNKKTTNNLVKLIIHKIFFTEKFITTFRKTPYLGNRFKTKSFSNQHDAKCEDPVESVGLLNKFRVKIGQKNSCFHIESFIIEHYIVIHGAQYHSKIILTIGNEIGNSLKQ